MNLGQSWLLLERPYNQSIKLPGHSSPTALRQIPWPSETPAGWPSHFSLLVYVHWRPGTPSFSPPQMSWHPSHGFSDHTDDPNSLASRLLILLDFTDLHWVHSLQPFMSVAKPRSLSCPVIIAPTLKSSTQCSFPTTPSHYSNTAVYPFLNFINTSGPLLHPIQPRHCYRSCYSLPGQCTQFLCSTVLPLLTPCNCQPWLNPTIHLLCS